MRPRDDADRYAEALWVVLGFAAVALIAALSLLVNGGFESC